MDYAPECWEYYGITPLTVWDLPTAHFFSMVEAIDRDRENRKEEQRKQEREARKNKGHGM